MLGGGRVLNCGNKLRVVLMIVNNLVYRITAIIFLGKKCRDNYNMLMSYDYK